MRFLRRPFCRALLLLLVLGSLALPKAWAKRIVAIGDIHGSMSGLSSILQVAGLVDADLNWIGGDAVLVQTGDYLDRGVELKEVTSLLRRLQQQAPGQGGRVEVLIGNHEAMNMLGVMRDVAPEAFARFADGDSEARREESFESFVRWARNRAKRHKEPRPTSTPEYKQEWMEQVPLGLLEYRQAIGPHGELGAWLRTLRTVVRVDDYVFLHGGISPALASWSEERINARVRQEVADLDACREILLSNHVIHETADPSQTVALGREELEHLIERIPNTPEPMRTKLAERGQTLAKCVNFEDWFLIKEDGPLWFRGLARWSDEEGAPLVETLLEARSARAFVVGHTPSVEGRIQERFDGRVFLIDTGMLSEVYKGGRASALEIRDDKITAIYEDGRDVLVDNTAPAGTTGASADRTSRAAQTGRLLTSPSTPRWPTSLTTPSLLPWIAGGLALRISPAAAAEGSGRRVLRDTEKKPLPFETEDEVLEFLRTAQIVDSKRIKQGINQPYKLTLKQGDVEAHAIFRDVEWTKERYRLNERFFPVFRDSYVHEVAAYQLSRFLGLDAVPPVVLRPYRGSQGSVQIWIENAMDEKTRLEEGIEPPRVSWLRSKLMTRVFDALIANIDRNAGNTLIQRDDFTFWMIDHTRSFFPQEELEGPYQVTQVERGFWERLKNADREEVKRLMAPYLNTRELDALLVRWDRLAAHLQARIDEFGEAAILFDTN